MPNGWNCDWSAGRAERGRPWRRLACALAGLFALLAAAGCATPPAPAIAADPPPVALTLDEATDALASRMLSEAEAAVFPPGTDPAARRTLVIDPLIDRASGSETAATRGIAGRFERMVRERHPRLELKPFTLAALEEQPLILLGAITQAAAPGSRENVVAPSDTYRIWAVIADLRTGRILTRPSAWVRADSLDMTPTAFYRDAPVWAPDAMRAAYLRTCSTAPGGTIDPVYLRGLRAQAEVAEAIRAYDAGRPEVALALYRSAAQAPAGGDQQRVLNGLYLAHRALGQEAEAEAAFARLVDFGLAQDRLAVRLLFRPGSTEFVREREISGPYPMWLRQIADRAARRPGCLLVSGHASVSGTAAANDRLSLARARAVRARLVAERPALAARSWAEGRGAREPIIGSGTDDLRDALDRRVEFAPRACAGTMATAPKPPRG